MNAASPKKRNWFGIAVVSFIALALLATIYVWQVRGEPFMHSLDGVLSTLVRALWSVILSTPILAAIGVLVVLYLGHPYLSPLIQALNSRMGDLESVSFGSASFAFGNRRTPSAPPSNITDGQGLSDVDDLQTLVAVLPAPVCKCLIEVNELDLSLGKMLDSLAVALDVVKRDGPWDHRVYGYFAAMLNFFDGRLIDVSGIKGSQVNPDTPMAVKVKPEVLELLKKRAAETALPGQGGAA